MSRWSTCKGSYRLIQMLAPSEFPEEEPDYRAEGTAAHELIERCLRDNHEPWEFLGLSMSNGVKVTIPMTTAVQVYLDEVMPLMRVADISYIEFPISAPIHPLFYGKLDLGVIRDNTLYVRDYKNGEGVYVDERGPQTKYYAYGVLHLHPEIRRVNIGVVQPNFSGVSLVRSYECDADDIHMWAMEELLPAMQAAEAGGELTPGEHCRFCPAKLCCPMLKGMFAAAANTPPPSAAAMSDMQLALDVKMIEPVKKYIKAIEEELFKRLNHGRQIDGFKLVHKKANRVWKEGADVFFFDAYGDEARNPAVMKSPAQIEDLGPAAASLVKQWAYTPESGLTVAPAKDPRIAIQPENSQKAFANMVDGLLKAEDI